MIIPLGMESLGLDRSAAAILLTCQSVGDLVGRIFVGMIGDCKGVDKYVGYLVFLHKQSQNGHIAGLKTHWHLGKI